MSNLFKYSRTPHLPFSEGATDDDKMLQNVNHFVGKEVVVTLKCDGENANCYRDYYHARSLDSKHHPSRSWMKSFHNEFKTSIPDGWRFVGENLYAKHSIFYKELKSYFYVFGIYDDKNICLSWDDTVEWCQLLNLEVVPVLYRGIWDEEKVKACYDPKNIILGGEQEGYVVRMANSFHYNDFSMNVAKMVRANHVQTNQFWMHQSIVPNLLKI